MGRPGQLHDVNTTDLEDAILLGCETMGRVFNADDADIPFFAATAWPDPAMGFNPSHSESHVPGRHLNALLAAEAALGIKAPNDVVDKHWAAARFSFSGPLPLPLNRELPGGPLRRFLPHNLREGFHALYAMACHRGADPAMRLMESSIDAVDRLWDPEAGWNRSEIEGTHDLLLVEWEGPFITGIARSIGPLVKYYRCTGYQPALTLAQKLADKATTECFTPDGTFDTARFGTHTHSTTSVLSSLAQLADVTSDSDLLSRVQHFYGNGLRDISAPIGWSIENAGPMSNPDRGECNNTGDIIETALILGRLVDPRFYGDAELMLRSHLLPSQLRDTSFIPRQTNGATTDGRRDVPRRLRGAFGFPAPYGHKPIGVSDVAFNLDIVGGAVASICEAYKESVTFTQEDGVPTHRLNMLFDRDAPDVMVRSPYTTGHLQVKVKRPGAIAIRLPEWVNPADIAVEGIDSMHDITHRSLTIANPPVGAPISVHFPLLDRSITLSHRDRSIEARLQGDRVTAMDAFGTDLRFFDPL